MATLFRPIKAGSTDVSVTLTILDSTTGLKKTDVVYNSAGMALSYRREGATTTAITEATLADAAAAHSDGGFVHIGDGEYRLDLPDAACATGVNGVLVHGAVTGGVIQAIYVPLVRVDFSATITDIRELGVLRLGTFQSASGTSAVLDSGASFADDEVNGAVLAAIGATGYGQSRLVLNGVGSTDTLDVDTWTTNPGATNFALFVSPPASSTSYPPVHVATMATDSVTDAALASDAAASVATATWANGTRTLTAGTNIALAKGTGLTGLNDVSTSDVQTSAATAITAASLASQASVDIIDNFLDTEIAAIKAKTDQLIFTKTNELDVNVQSINGATVTGDGNATPWDGA